MATDLNGIAVADYVLSQKPEGGLFAGQEWRIAPEPFPLPVGMVKQLDRLGRVLLQFYRAVNLLYRKSIVGDGDAPSWCSELLDKGKPEQIRAFQNHPAFKNELPRVIRPDILLTDDGMKITELDSVPGGMGLTAWLNKSYAEANPTWTKNLVGGDRGMIQGFNSIFGPAEKVWVVVSQESQTYKPEMEWMAAQLGSKYSVVSPEFKDFRSGDAVYRFFELYDLPQVENGPLIFERSAEKYLTITPPPKAIFEEKMLFGLLWNRNLQEFWRKNLGDSFLHQLQQLVPFTWILDPAPLPPQAAYPRLNLTDWKQLKSLSQKERELILKISGFSENAWGARGVSLGSDMPVEEWSGAVDHALAAFDQSPFVLQQFFKPSLHRSAWADFGSRTIIPMEGRVRLCPYYFVSGAGDAARAQLSGILATICPPDKKIIHGMSEAILAPVMQV
jgi:hypothetical protein